MLAGAADDRNGRSGTGVAVTIGDLFERIDGTRSLSMLWALMIRYYREQGFDAVAYILFDKGRLGEAVAILEQGFPPEVVEAYGSMGYGQHDSTLRIAMSTGRPQVPTEVVARHKLSKQEWRHRNTLLALGSGLGLCLPLFGPNGRDAYGILGRPVDPDFACKVNRTEMHMAAQAAHLKVCGFQRRRLPGALDLSQREVEILRWVAKGKSNGVIAEILEISAGTVDTYLRRIFEKMGVADRTSAAVKGVSMGLVRV